MHKDFIKYDFDTNINDYTISYDPTKLNMGHLMTRVTDSNGNYYVSPIESRFFRGYEFGNNLINVMGFLKYNDTISWIFYTNGNDTPGAKVFYLVTHNKVTNEFTQIGSISNSILNAHGCTCIIPSMENHTSGTVTVNQTSVIGSGTSWQTNGVCSGNRIGFGSTNPSLITEWYTISSVVNNTTLIIRSEFSNDGNTSILSLPAGTPYVIEDFRLIYINRNIVDNASRCIALIKGLRFENFRSTSTVIPAATTVDNLRAFYRINGEFTGLILENKVSFTEQYLFTQSAPVTTTITVQKFNIRAALTVSGGVTTSAFVLSTANLAHGGTNLSIVNSFIKGSNGDYYANFYTRISRIIPANITSGSTNYIGDSMSEIPPGTTTTFPTSSQLQGFHYLPEIDKFYLSHEQGTIRNYITSYSGAGSQFDRTVNLNDIIQSNTYVVDEIDILTANFISLPIRTYYHDGLSYFLRVTPTNSNVIYTLPIEADKEYHTASKACIITPEITTPNVSSYDKIYLNKKSYFNNGRFITPTENVDVYFRTSGISDDSGAWTLIDKNGDISYASGSSIQFKIAFGTIGINCIPSEVYSLSMSYFNNGIPTSIPYYEPSLKHTNISSEIFAWRQVHNFVNNIPTLNLNVYNVAGNTLLLSDDTNTPTNGVWEYSSNNGITWNPFSSSANAIGNYIRYTPNLSLGSGIKIKPILYKSATQAYVSPSPAPIPAPLDFDAELFLLNANITDNTTKNAINQLVIDMKNANIWSKMTLIYPFVGGNSTSHKWNLKNPYSNQLGFAGGWTHTAMGAESNGTNAYGNPSISMGVLGVTDWSLGVYTNFNTPTTGYMFAGTNNNFSDYMGLLQNPITTMVAYLGRSSINLTETVNTTTQKGFWAIAANSTNRSFFKSNGVIQTSTVTNPTSYDGTPIVLAAVTGAQSFSFLQSYQRNRFAFAYISKGLTDPELTTLSNMVYNFQVTLGRNA
jgi:hypothetical protein